MQTQREYANSIQKDPEPNWDSNQPLDVKCVHCRSSLLANLVVFYPTFCFLKNITSCSTPSWLIIRMWVSKRWQATTQVGPGVVWYLALWQVRSRLKWHSNMTDLVERGAPLLVSVSPAAWSYIFITQVLYLSSVCARIPESGCEGDFWTWLWESVCVCGNVCRWTPGSSCQAHRI